jgi:hypothetical protein
VTLALGVVPIGASIAVVLLLMHIADLKRAPPTPKLPKPSESPVSFWETKADPAKLQIESKQERILIVLAEKAHSVFQLAKKTGAEAELVKYHLHKLEELDLVSSATGAAGTFWRLEQPGREYLMEHGLL